MSAERHTVNAAVPTPIGASASVDAPIVANSSTLTDTQFNVPKHLQGGTITRHFMLNFRGSLSDMADTPSRASWAPTEHSIFQSRTRYAPNAAKSTTRQGNLRQAILIGMKVKKIESTFPCQLGVCISGCKGNLYTGNGQRYSYITGANEQQTNLDQIIATTNPFVNSDYLRMYPGM